MDDFEEKLNQILSSPQTMEQILSLASSLSGDGADPPDAQPPSGEESSPLPLPDAALLGKLMPLLSVWQQGEDDKTRLLEAMKPFLRQERVHKLDQAIRIARLSRVIRTALELLRGDGNV